MSSIERPFSPYSGGSETKEEKTEPGLLLEALPREQSEEYDGQLVSAIKKSSYDEFELFLLRDLPECPNLHFLSSRVVEAVLEKAYSIFDERMKKNPTSAVSLEENKILYGVMHATNTALGFVGDEKNNDSLADKTFKTFLRLYQKYPDASDGFWQIWSNDLQIISPDLLVEGLADMLWRPETSQHFRDTSLHGFNALYAFYQGQKYDEAISSHLDFENPEHYFKTATFLEFVKVLSSLSDQLAFSERRGVSSRLRLVLQNAVDKQRGSYLLNLRAGQVMELMRTESVHWRESDRVPFLLSKNLYAFDREGELHAVPQDVLPQFEKSLQEYQYIETMIKKEALAGNGFPVSPDPNLFRAWQGKMLELQHYAHVPLGIADFTFARPDKSDKQKEQDQQNLFDYRYLVSKPIRAIVEKEFGLRLSDLSLHEHFYFLQFIKNKNAKDSAPVQNFIRRFRKEGARAFLSLEYGGLERGQKVLELADRLPGRETRTLFSFFGSVLDSVDGVSRALEKGFSRENSTHDKLMQGLPGEFHEAIIRRTIDLLLAAREGDGEKEPHFEVHDVIRGMKAVAVLWDILKSIAGEKSPYVILTREEDHNSFCFIAGHEFSGRVYELKFFVRPVRGAEGEARINVELGFDTTKTASWLNKKRRGAVWRPDSALKKAFAQDIMYHGKGEKRRIARLRLALDLDSFYSPPRVSLDMGRDRRENKKFMRSGDPVGRALSRASAMGHHNIHSFDPEYGNPEVFAEIAKKFQEYLREQTAQA